MERTLTLHRLGGQGFAPQFTDHEHHGTLQRPDQRVLAQDQALGNSDQCYWWVAMVLKEAGPRLKLLKHMDQLRALQATPF